MEIHRIRLARRVFEYMVRLIFRWANVGRARVGVKQRTRL
jgi:hypothetical protein